MAAKVEAAGRRPRNRYPAAQTLFWVAAAVLLVSAVLPRERPIPQRAGGTGASVEQRGRGRHATRPSEIQLRGWKDILARVRRSIGEDRVVAIAAGIAFFALLAIFPAIAALVSLYGLFADPASIGVHLDSLSGFVPEEGLRILRSQMTRVTSTGSSSLGFAFVVSLAISLWSANGGTKALFDALNVVYGEEEKRGFLKLNAISLLFTLGGILMFLLAVATLVVIPTILDLLGLDEAGRLVDLARWPLLLAGIGVWLSLIYRFGPSREKAQWRWLSWGSAFAAMAWLIASMLFSWYAANFASYNKTYGSLGAMIAFATWIWLSAIVILVGGEINAETEHQTLKDTTTGAPQPMGDRGAVRADTVGESRS